MAGSKFITSFISTYIIAWASVKEGPQKSRWLRNKLKHKFYLKNVERTFLI